ncbi:MAG: hypothetical protein ABSF23_14610 [Terracidiphilus sp.]
MATAEEIERAVEHQGVHGGRLGESLVAMGAISQSRLEEFLRRMPAEPADVAATGVDARDLMGLLVKLIDAGRLESVRQFAQAIKLPYPLVLSLVQMAVDRKLLMSLGSRDTGNLAEVAYTLSDEGRRWALDQVNRCGYIGPAPVPIEQFTRQVKLQKITNEVVTPDRIRKAMSGLTLEDDLIEQCGPALNSGRATLLYGAPGNGKTSVAHRLANVFYDVIFVPYALDVEGQIIRVYDPGVHTAVERAGPEEDGPLSLVRHDVFDARWVACSRPCVIAGGELTLDMLDLRWDATGHYYEAPLHVKALGGCFVIDDFGHQLVSPTNLLNRWIVPLENRVDHLKLHTGKTITIPFEELIIFSTNMEPEDLMDTAFLRRLPYKIEVGTPTVESYRKIFEDECAKEGFELSREAFEAIVQKVRKEKGMELARYQPKFIVDQVVASCRFLQQTPRFEPRLVNCALDNLRVKRRTPAVVAKAA